jgi:hypothetical protein
MYARNDRSRGVWSAPAGADAVLAGVVDAAMTLSDDAVAALTAKGVNCIRRVGAGLVVWGAETIQSGSPTVSEWKYVPVRRLALFIEESLRRGTEWAVFEPNDESLWSKLRLQSGVFLDGLFRAGALQGRTPNAAYFVRCGRDTMTQNDIDNGRVKLLVGFAPLRPAEFVTIEIKKAIGRLITETLDSTGRPSERIRLAHRPVRAEGVFLQVRDRDGWTTWTPAERFDDFGPADAVYVLDREAGELVFGDGEHGALVPAGTASVQATYRYGVARRGNAAGRPTD